MVASAFCNALEYHGNHIVTSNNGLRDKMHGCNELLAMLAGRVCRMSAAVQLLHNT